MPNSYHTGLPDAAAAKKLGFTIDSSCYPWVAYKGPRFSPEIFYYVPTDKEAALTKASYAERADVRQFQEKFGVPMADKPSLLDQKTFDFRRKFMQEELNEFSDSHVEGDLIGAADALVDLVYVVHGTALMMGLPWEDLWNEVQRANMTKERAATAAQSKRGSALDVIKPPGWKGPDHAQFLGLGHWPMFCAVCRSSGFTSSSRGTGCTFCDGTEGGSNEA